jgi:hypothetical protein
MRSLKSIKLKAAFLLTVFTVNTLVSFACSVGLDMGFNTSHHSNEKKAKIHSHGHKHAHGIASDGKHSHSAHSHATAHKHSHDLASGLQKNQDQKDNCCTEKSVELQKQDKSANHSSNPVIKIPVLVPFLAAFCGYEMEAELSPILHNLFIPQYYPPPDKRIIIQSFQI